MLAGPILVASPRADGRLDVLHRLHGLVALLDVMPVLGDSVVLDHRPVSDWSDFMLGLIHGLRRDDLFFLDGVPLSDLLDLYLYFFRDVLYKKVMFVPNFALKFADPVPQLFLVDSLLRPKLTHIAHQSGKDLGVDRVATPVLKPRFGLFCIKSEVANVV